jgi:hypothetical protein
MVTKFDHTSRIKYNTYVADNVSNSIVNSGGT